MPAQHIIVAPEHSCSIWTSAGHARRPFDNLSRRRRGYSSTRFLSSHRLLRRSSRTLRSGGCDTQSGVRLRPISKASSKDASTRAESHIDSAPGSTARSTIASLQDQHHAYRVLDIHDRQNQRPRTTAASIPTNCAAMNAPTPVGAMPAKVSDSARAIVTAGLANDVEDVNQ